MTTLFDLDHLIEVFISVKKKNILVKDHDYNPFENYENRSLQPLPENLQRKVQCWCNNSLR
jgi:hypothetical protein